MALWENNIECIDQLRACRGQGSISAKMSTEHGDRGMEGPLSKWTNVMKGWQYRWFVLDHQTGLLSYYTVRLKDILKDVLAFMKSKM